MGSFPTILTLSRYKSGWNQMRSSYTYDNIKQYVYDLIIGKSINLLIIFVFLVKN